VARAKSTRRAEARRRHRAAQAAAGQPIEDEVEAEDEEPAPPARQPLFKAPDLRGDLRALPDMFRTHRTLWLPPILILAGFVVAMVRPLTDPNADFWAGRAVELVFLPYGLLPFFIGGFVAPRAAYLVGLLLGLLNGLLLLVYAFSKPVPEGVTDLAPAAISFAFVAVASGAIFAAFAAWYRRFLRGSQERAQARREARAREQRREQKRQPSRQTR
jgi:hypothetical protein